ncbi:MAG TPA: serine/threonine-protein kinase [Kofleriaceae bacterium]|jgi:tRNA A-37 threonylcarbamoyl transferase component Bud32
MSKPIDRSIEVDATVLPQSGTEKTLAAGTSATVASLAGGATSTTVDENIPVISPSSYQISDEVARGGMGRILRARDRRLDRPVAIKELLERDSDLEARFMREALITAKLQHPAIVPVYEAGQWPSGERFYTMKLVAGRPFDKVIAEQTTLAGRLALLPQLIAVCEAIAYAHDHRIIHRDLKPQNVLVGQFGETVVVDWGLAKDLASADPDARYAGPYRQSSGTSTMIGSILGTPAYMPPEQAEGDAVDETADVYSLGVILYVLLTSRLPFVEGNVETTLERVRTQTPQSVAAIEPEVPEDLAAIVGKAMQRTPGDRYPNAAALVEDLKRFQTGQLVGVHRYTAAELWKRWARKNRTALTISAIALAVLAVIGVVAVSRVIAANNVAMAERDEANKQRDIATTKEAEAVAQKTLADGRASAAYIESARQEWLAGQHERAAAYLAAGYRGPTDSRATRMLVGLTTEALGRQHKLEKLDPRPVIDSWWYQGGTRLALVHEHGDAIAETFDGTTGKHVDETWTDLPIVARSDNGEFILQVSASTHVARLLDLNAQGRDVPLPDGVVISPGAHIAIATTGDRIALLTDNKLTLTGLGAKPKTVTLPFASCPKFASVDLEVTSSLEGDRIFVGGYQCGFIYTDDAPIKTLRSEGAVFRGGSGFRFIAVALRPGRYTSFIGGVKADDMIASERDMDGTNGAPRLLAISQDGTDVIVAGYRSADIVRWRHDVSTIPGHLASAAFAGDYLVATDYFGVGRVWNGDPVRIEQAFPASGQIALAAAPYVPGSHELATMSQQSFFAGDRIVTRDQLVQTEVDELGAIRDPQITNNTNVRGTTIDHQPSMHGADIPAHTLDITLDERFQAACADADCSSVNLVDTATKAVRGPWKRGPNAEVAFSGPVLVIAASGETPRTIVSLDGHDVPSAVAAIPDTCRFLSLVSTTHVRVECSSTEAFVAISDGARDCTGASQQTAISTDDARCLEIDDKHHVRVTDRKTHERYALLGNSIGSVVERHGIVYTRDSIGTIALWDRESGRQLAELGTGDEVAEGFLAVSPDGTRVLGGDEHEAMLYRLPIDARDATAATSALTKASRWTIRDGRLVEPLGAP